MMSDLARLDRHSEVMGVPPALGDENDGPTTPPGRRRDCGGGEVPGRGARPRRRPSVGVANGQNVDRRARRPALIDAWAL